MSHAGGPPSPVTVAPLEHSRAFETLVKGPDDLSGLLAYALYKQAIREAAQERRPLPTGAQRTPTPTERDAYRQAADRRLAAFADQATSEARLEIIEGSIGNVVSAAKSDLVNHVTKRTSFWGSILANIIAWFFSIFLTVMIVFAAQIRDLAGQMLEWLKG